eukprot:6189936-Pleurochrysis_carterae.AAC.3
MLTGLGAQMHARRGEPETPAHVRRLQLCPHVAPRAADRVAPLGDPHLRVVVRHGAPCMALSVAQVRHAWDRRSVAEVEDHILRHDAPADAAGEPVAGAAALHDARRRHQVV